jgi:peptidoglycan/xylan/chitin deacetylase (PgdA/CDA1 family)
MRAILTYHSIDESGSPISMPAAAFEAHRQWLLSGVVRPLSLEDVLRPSNERGNAVALTFDDGFVSSRRPIEQLLEAGIKPTLFVVTGHVGGTNAWGGRDQPVIPTLPLMTWDELGRLSERGLRIEAHSRTHPHLSRLSAAQLDDELGGSCEDLRSRLGLRSTCFAYPYGDFNSLVAERTANWFASAVTVEMEPLGDSSLPMLLPRLDMYYYRTAHSTKGWGSLGFRVRLQGLEMRRLLRAVMQRAGR